MTDQQKDILKRAVDLIWAKGVNNPMEAATAQALTQWWVQESQAKPLEQPKGGADGPK